MPDSETRTCQNCKASFVIDASDFLFYEKMKVPPPTFCPECRFRRRLAFRNELSLYHRRCDLCSKNIISIYRSPSPFPVYCNTCWFSDQWDATVYGQDYESGKSFLVQFQELIDKVPHLALNQFKNTNCEYTNFSAECKNCYLSVSILQCENVMYSARAFNSRDSLDCLDITKSEECYECIRCDQCFQTSFAQYSENLVECRYCFDCKGLSNCFGCVGLRSKDHHILNQPLSKEAYASRIKEIQGSPIEMNQFLKRYRELVSKHPRRYAHVIKSVDCTGDHIMNGKHCSHCFFVKDSINSANIFNATNLKDSRDVSWDDNSELSYEVMSGEHDHMYRLGTACWYSQFLEYCAFCLDSHNLFGCAGMNKKEFCVLNKPYSKGEFEALRARIIKDMDDRPYIDRQGRIYRYGEFLPLEFSPFAYNESVIHQYFPLSKDEASRKGFSWHVPEAKSYKVTTSTAQLPEIQNVPESILKETIGCAHEGKCSQQCTTAFRIIPEELAFYRRMSLPLPRLCPNCRHYERLKQRNPLKLWHRSCQCAGTKGREYTNTVTHFHGEKPCPNEFETTFASNRPEVVYCESCYNAEVV